MVGVAEACGGILFGGRGVASEAPHGRMERRVVAHHLRSAGCNEIPLTETSLLSELSAQAEPTLSHAVMVGGHL